MSLLGAITAALLGLGEGTELRLLKELEFRGWALIGATALCLALPGAVTTSGNSAKAGATLEERKLPMRFNWVDCQPNCRGWISAVGIVTADSPRDFEEFARGRDLAGATIVLDSSGGSVNDSIALGRRFRGLGMLTTVGVSLRGDRAKDGPSRVLPDAYCESMCVFLLLAGKARYVPEAARIRVHQIWMGDRADDPRAASYTAQDVTIIERDIGRLAKYTFDMGGTGDLLQLALGVAPWEDLHQMSRQELGEANLVTTEAIADLLPQQSEGPRTPVATAPKPVQDRFVQAPTAPTKTAEAALPTGGTAPTSPPTPGH